VKVSVLPRDSTNEGAFDVSNDKRTWHSVVDVFDYRNPALKDGHLSVYKSSPGRSRWFCDRCGTSVGYSVDPGIIPPEWEWPQMLDLWSATIDREDLEKDYMAPERMVWCHYGVPWIQGLVREGAGGIPEHPLTKIEKVLGDDIEDDLKQMAALEESVKM